MQKQFAKLDINFFSTHKKRTIKIVKNQSLRAVQKDM